MMAGNRCLCKIRRKDERVSGERTGGIFKSNGGMPFETPAVFESSLLRYLKTIDDEKEMPTLRGDNGGENVCGKMPLISYPLWQ